jgi:hypothetical protein
MAIKRFHLLHSPEKTNSQDISSTKAIYTVMQSSTLAAYATKKRGYYHHEMITGPQHDTARTLDHRGLLDMLHELGPKQTSGDDGESLMPSKNLS